MKKFIVYSRQSKVDENSSGQMTLETADFTIRHYLSTLGEEGVDYEVVGTFKEVKSGYGKKSRNRIEFNKAIELCYEHGYSLLVSNITRLSRNTAHGAQLIEDLDVVVASSPTMSNTMKNMMLVLGEEESYQQSLRRKAVYQAKKEKCERLGVAMEWGASSPKYQQKLKEGKINHVGKSRHAKTITHLHSIKDLFQKSIDLIKQGVVQCDGKAIKAKSYRQVALGLNSLGLCTPASGGEWNSGSVQRSLEILDIKL